MPTVVFTTPKSSVLRVILVTGLVIAAVMVMFVGLSWNKVEAAKPVSRVTETTLTFVACNATTSTTWNSTKFKKKSGWLRLELIKISGVAVMQTIDHKINAGSPGGNTIEDGWNTVPKGNYFVKSTLFTSRGKDGGFLNQELASWTNVKWC